MLINIDNKLILSKFQIIKVKNKIIISISKEFIKINNNNNNNNNELDYIKIPIYNSYNGLDYITITMPLELNIYDEYIFNPYIILSSLNLEIDNELDFFYNLEIIIKNKYNLNFLKFKDIKLFHIQNYITNNLENNNIWLKINILKLLFIYNNSYKDFKILFDQLKNYKYNIFTNDKEIKFKFSEWNNNIINSNINFNNLIKNNYYYILLENLELDSNEIILKIKILDIDNDNLTLKINNDKKILYANYKWFYYYPKTKINKDYLIYNFFMNNNINLIILKYIIGDNQSFNYNDILNYYSNNNKLSNIITFTEINEMDIIRSNSFTDIFFKDIIHKYRNDEDKILEILIILFNNYNYPLKMNRHEIDDIFNYILYISLYNYKVLYFNDILKLKFLEIIPIKLKNLYLNILKVLINIINNNYDNITYNQKYYNDYLHRNIIKLFLINSSKISIELFKKLSTEISYKKFKSIFSRNLLLFDISYKLSWNTLSKKLNYLNIFYKNLDIVFYQNKINKNIISDNFDIKIKKIIENPLEMYKYLKKENDFIKWSKFIIDKLNNLYYIPISLNNTDDITNISKMLYLLLNINEQSMKDITYINFVQFCIEHSHLILNNTRINLKIKEIFNNLKCNINLGYLAKDLTLHKNIITFDNDPINNLDLESKLKIAIDKYLKYKGKYLKYKNNNKINCS